MTAEEKKKIIRLEQLEVFREGISKGLDEIRRQASPWNTDRNWQDARVWG